eukprot:5767289-Pyramimonas_sp.AAC.2
MPPRCPTPSNTCCTSVCHRDPPNGSPKEARGQSGIHHRARSPPPGALQGRLGSRSGWKDSPDSALKAKVFPPPGGGQPTTGPLGDLLKPTQASRRPALGPTQAQTPPWGILWPLVGLHRLEIAAFSA